MTFQISLRRVSEIAGVASEYHGVVHELETFEQALGAVEGLQTEVGTLRLGSENVMRSSREALPGFLGKMQKYDSPFGSGGSSKSEEMRRQKSSGLDLLGKYLSRS